MDSSLLDKAIKFAVNAHHDTERRGKGFPYIVHPLEAMAIVATMTPDQELLAAAALHDTVEDTDVTVEQLEKEFGRHIAELVEAETDKLLDEGDESATWRERKAAGIRHIAEASLEVKIVAMGDKLSNMRAIARDYDEIGDSLWNRFHAPGGKADHEWRYRSLVESFSALAGTAAYAEFSLLVDKVFAEK